MKSTLELTSYRKGNTSIDPIKSLQDLTASGFGTFLGTGGFIGGLQYIAIDKTVGIDNYLNSFIIAINRYGETGDPCQLAAWKR